MPFRPIQQTGDAPLISVPKLRTRPVSLTPANQPASQKAASDAPPKKRVHHKTNRTGPNWDADGNYIVGKGRPPKATQWGKGQSGNERGPTKREPVSAQAQFEQTLLAPFNATVNGEIVPLTMDVFAVQSLKNAAAKGSVKAAHILLDLYSNLIRNVAEREPGPEVDAWEQEAIDRLLSELGLPERPVVRQTDRLRKQ